MDEIKKSFWNSREQKSGVNEDAKKLALLKRIFMNLVGPSWVLTSPPSKVSTGNILKRRANAIHDLYCPRFSLISLILIRKKVLSEY